MYKLLVMLLVLSLLFSACTFPAAPQAGKSSSTPHLPAKQPTRQATTQLPATPAAAAPPLEARASGLSGHHPSEPVTISFNQPMDPASAGPAVLTYPWTSGEISWNRDATQLTFTPAGGLTPAGSYHVFLNDDLRSASGQRFQDPPHWKLETLDPPQVLSHSPSLIRLVDRQPAITLEFDRPMRPGSLESALTVSPSLAYSLAYRERTTTIQLKEPLQPGSRYRFRLAGSAEDANGIPLSKDYTWEYALPEAVSSISGLSNAIELEFAYNMDSDRLVRSARLDPPIPGVWRSPSARSLVFRAKERLPYSTRFTVSFTSPLLDEQGTEIPAPAPLQLSTPAPILGYYPSEEYVQNPAARISLSFAVPVDRTSVEAAFSIEPAVAGGFDWQGDTLNYNLTEPFVNNTRYTVRLGTGARDANGAPLLLEPFSWSFQVYLSGGEALSGGVSFGDYGPNAQVLDADGRRLIQYVAGRDVTSIECQLYRLSLPDFLDRYASGFRGAAGYERAPISVEGAELAKSWTADLPVQGFGWDHNIHELLIPEDVRPGLYILNVQAANGRDGSKAQLILLLTRHTLMVKQAGGQLLVWATDINGGSRSGMRVGVYARDGRLLAEGVTGSNGLFETSVGVDPKPLIVVAQDGADITASGLSNEWQTGGSGWNAWWLPARPEYAWAAHLHSDRPIYRPGQTVYYKAIVRRDDDALLNLPPPGTAVQVRIRDARENVVATYDLATDDFGSVYGAFALAEGAMLGAYKIEASLDGELHTLEFKVQDYRKPDYRVEVSTGASAYVAGETISVTVDSQYFFGQPVTGAHVSLRRFFVQPNYSWYVEPSQDVDAYTWYSGGEPIHGETGPDGRFATSLPAEMEAGYDDSPDSYYGWSSLRTATWGIEASVEDGSGQSISSFKVVKVHNASEKILLDVGGFVKAAGQEFTVWGSVVTLDGASVAGRPLEFELRTWVANSYRFNNVLQTERLASGPDDAYRLPLTVTSPGYYQVRLTGADSGGRVIRNSEWIYVTGSANSWASEYIEDLRITPDQDRYRPGSVARLVVESSFSGPALLTLERAAVRRTQPVYLSAPLTLVEVPVLLEDAPNIFATLSAWKPVEAALNDDTYTSIPDSRLRTAQAEIQVDVLGKRLKVQILPDRETYAPRQEASFTLRVTDEAGAPVQAQVSLAMVDEAIYSLSKELSGPLFEAFYAPRPNRVETYDSLALERYLIMGGYGGGGGEPSASPRSQFPDTAAWFPALLTDEKGEVQVSLTMPDSLTTWRLTARAVTAADTQVGEATQTILTQQPVVVRPVLPRSLTAGDTVSLSALVHNYSGAAQDFTVQMQADPADPASSLLPLLVEGDPQSLHLEPGQARSVSWTAHALAPGLAAITVRAASASNGEGSGDAVRLTLAVLPLAVPEVTTETGQFSGSLTTLLVRPPGVLANSTVEVELSRSIAGTLLTGLEFLTSFPYGCVEQTMSKALPNAAVGRALFQLGVSNPTLQADLPAQINAGLQRLYGYQHTDGGWGWWYDDTTHDYQTAWVVFGLAVTRQAGYEVDPGVIERGAAWLKANLDGMDPRTRAYALYSLSVAGYGDLELTRLMLAEVSALDTFSQAALALAFHQLGAAVEANQLLDGLAESAGRQGEWALWPNPYEDGHYYEKTMSSTLRSTALALEAFVQIRPDHPLVPGIVAYLMSQRRLDGWGSTNETSYTLLALTDHLLSKEELTADSEYNIHLNGGALAAGRLGRGEPFVHLTLPIEQLGQGANPLEITASGAGDLYYRVVHRLFFETAQVEAAGVAAITRTYVDAATREPVVNAYPGQLVRVTLTVDLPRDAFFVILEDRLPGGLEALNERLNTTSHIASQWEEPELYWQSYGYNNKEVWGDRVSFFIRELEAGRHTYTYLARVTLPGGFSALPVELSAMYDASLWGRSASSAFLVVPTP